MGSRARLAEARLFGEKDKAGERPVLVDREKGAYRIVRIGATKIADQWVNTSAVDPRLIFSGVWIFHSISVRNAQSQVSEPTEIYMYDETQDSAISLATGLTSEYQKLHWTNGSKKVFRGQWIPRARVYCSTENVGQILHIDVVAEKLEAGV
jgi:hypothetical protein